MSDLLDEDAPDAEDFVICAMASVMGCSAEKFTGDEWPFCIVQRVAGADLPDEGIDYPVIQLDFYAPGIQAAKAAANEGHRRLMYLARNLVDITMSDGSIANADYVKTFQKAVKLPYADDLIRRYSARYELGLSYVAV